MNISKESTRIHDADAFVHERGMRLVAHSLSSADDRAALEI